MNRIPIVNVILEEKGKILMLKRNFFPANKLDILGGYVEAKESIEEAAIREAKEESGFEVKLVKKLGVYNYFDRGEKRMNVFLGEINSGELRSSEEGTLLWVNPETLDIKELAFPQVHIKVINDFLRSKTEK